MPSAGKAVYERQGEAGAIADSGKKVSGDLRAPRLVVIGPIAPPAGGMANQTRQLVELWRAEGLGVDLVPVNPPYRAAWIGRVRGVRAVFRLLFYIPMVWRALDRVDVVHIMANSGWSWFLFVVPPLVLGRLRRVACVVNYRGGCAGEFLDRFGWAVKPFMRCADAIVVPSTFLREIFSPHGIPVRIVPNIIDTERFHWREPPTIRPLNPRIVVTRHLELIYDVATAVRAFQLVHRQVPGATLTIAGAGPELSALEQMVAESGLGDAVTFPGSLSVKGMAELYHSADIMLNTSRVDNMPNSILEALASGVPVVSTKVGGIPHMVRDKETALLIEPGDTEAAAAAVLRILNDRALAAGLAQRGRQAVAQYTWQAVRQQWLSLYRRVLGWEV
ncbi:glycosyltransferase family 4 protein [Nitrococcus mobilis]|uniref:Glycosyl transferase, group 1 n=1 Tax=Nitrococcus mobilis Nb-231 TaxID=314278 RepID=A4BSJ5_9GAMM|nr:glycosyltransferase family 4 protein [Nitrococcus mobilis]EAR21265.1 Glycosyl transferase, group 1 [Nitrococcus mobilis Nb-231]